MNTRLIYVPSTKIRESVEKQDLWVPSPEECKAADLLGTFASGISMVGSYFDLCSTNQMIPSQEDYISSSLKFHSRDIGSLSTEQLNAMKARLARTYNTLVAEHSLLSLCTESGNFCECYKEELLNTHESVDLVVKLNEDSHPIGFAIHLSTPGAKKWQVTKNIRQAGRGKRWPWPVKHIWADFKRMQRVSNIHLFEYFYGANIVLTMILFDTPALKEFNTRFLLATHPYPPKVAKQLLRECREDIELLGWEYAQRKWAKFVGI